MTTIRYTRYLHHAISRPAMLLSALLLCMLPVLAGCANTDSPAASGPRLLHPLPLRPGLKAGPIS